MTLMPRKKGDPLSSLAYLDAVYGKTEPLYAFSAETEVEWKSWHRSLKRKLKELLGGFPDATPLKVEILEEVDLTHSRRLRLSIHTEPKTVVPAYLFIPNGVERKAPAMLAVHGHGSQNDVVGIAETEDDVQLINSERRDCAVQLAQRGYVTLAPVLRGFGGRRELNERGQATSRNNSCRQISLNAILLGKTDIGMQVWDIMRCVDYLQALPEVDPKRIGILGKSFGGAVSMYTSALDSRLQVTILSASFGLFHDTLMSLFHCECNYVPGILQYADMPDIAALIAPRPLLIESGSRDPIWPQPSAKKGYNHAARAYSVLGARERIAIDAFEGGHVFSGRKAFAWLEKWL